MKEPHPHQLTPEEWAACEAEDARDRLNQAKIAAREAYLAAKRALDQLDETADAAWIAHAKAARDHAAKLHEALVRETEW